MMRWISTRVWLLTAGWVVLAHGTVHAQIVISCPSPVQHYDTGWDFCAPIQFQFPEGVCGCSSGGLYVVNCTARTGGGVPLGCNADCWTYDTETPCPGAEAIQPTGNPSPPPPGGPTCPPYTHGQPVSVTTGEMFLSHADGAVGTLGFTRTYNSAQLSPASRYGPFGPGWNSSFDSRLTILSATIIEARLTDGSPRYYVDKNADGLYDLDLPYGTDSWIETIPGGYKRGLRAGGFETYTSQGQIITATDAVGVATSYGRDPQGRLTSVTHLGRTLVIGYEGTSTKPAQIEGPGGALARYSYHPQSGLLVAVDYPDGTGYRYGYDSSARIVWVRDAAGKPLEAHAYDAQGRAITSEIGDGQEKLTFTYAANQTTVTDALGNATVFDWTTLRHVYRITKITGPCQGCGAGGGDSREWTYDALGNITAYQDGGANRWAYVYDANNDLVSSTDPLNRTTSYTYDTEGRVTSVIAPGGGSTSTTYGPAGPLTLTEAVTATESRTTTIAYNGQGRPTTITDPRNKVTTLAYNTAGDLVSVTDPLSHTTSFGYDALGRRTTVTDPLDHTTTTAYDARGRVSRITSPDGTHTDFAYDASGRRSTVTDPLGHLTRYAYDDYGRLSAVVDPLNGTTRYGYDLMSNLTSLTDAKGQTTGFEYDAFHRVKKVIYPGGAFESFAYDAAGRLSTKTDRKNVTTTYSYDLLDRLTGKSYSDEVTPAVSYSYDEAGRLATAGNGSDGLTWTYDLAGELLSEASSRNASIVAYTYDSGGNRATVSLNGVLFLSYGYDDASRLTSITRGSSSFGFAYDAANRRTSMSYPNGVVTAYTYDTLNRLTRLKADLGSTAITDFQYLYDDAGNRTRKQQLDYTEDYSYDGLYRLTGVERSGGLTGRQLFSYDPVGNRLAQQVDDAVSTLSYDQRNELLGRGVGGPMRWRGTLSEPGSVSFTSALVNGKPAKMLAGNVFEAVLDMVPGTNAVTVQATDVSGNVATKQYSVEVSGTGASYTYDPNGNLASKTEGTDNWVYTWNAENQLTKVEKNSVEQARFAYDPLGRRVEKVAGAVTTSWVYDGEDILRRTAGGTSTLHVHGPGIDEPLASEQGGVLTHLHADGLGSVLKATNAAGVVASGLRYDAWGNVEQGAPDAYAYTGREWDPETGLYYYRARYYAPQLGRFISEDPLKWEQGPNFFLYVRANPVVWVDPSGKQCCSKECPSGNWYYNAGFGAAISAVRGGSWSWGEYQCADPDKWFVRRAAFSKCKSWGLHVDIGVSFDQQYWGSAVSGVYCKRDLPSIVQSVSWNITIGPANLSHSGPPHRGNLQGVSGSPSLGFGVNKQWCDVFLE